MPLVMVVVCAVMMILGGGSMMRHTGHAEPPVGNSGVETNSPSR